MLPAMGTTRNWLTVLSVCLLGMSVVFAVDCTMDRLNVCLDHLKMLKENHTMRFPTSEAALDETCKVFDNGVNCIRYYADDCWTNAHKDLFHSIAGGAIDTMGDLCKRGIYRQTYMKHSQCLSKFEDIESENGECGMFYSKIMRANDRAKDPTVRPEERLRRVCCAYHEFNSCYLHMVLKDCGQASADFVAEHTLRVAGESLQTKCAPYNFGSRNCSHVNVVSGTGHYVDSAPYDVMTNTGDHVKSSLPYSLTSTPPSRASETARQAREQQINTAAMLQPRLITMLFCFLLCSELLNSAVY